MRGSECGWESAYGCVGERAPCACAVGSDCVAAFDSAAGVWEPLDVLRPAPPCGLDCCLFARTAGVYALQSALNADLARCRPLWRYSYESNKWKKIESAGPFSHDYFECCASMGDKVYCYGLRTNRTYVLDFLPSLRTLCMVAVNSLKLDVACLPTSLQQELVEFRW